MSALRAGIIGLGVGEAHIEGYKIAGVDVVGVCDFDKSKLEQIGRKNPGIKFKTDNAIEILTNPEIDIVSIASFDNYHAEQIIQGIEHDKHLFIEKPLCLCKAEAKRIRHSLKSKPNLKLSSNLILRMSPRFQHVRKLVRSSILGDLFHLEGDYNYGRVNKIISGWRGSIESYSVTLGGGVHIIDLLLWMTGENVKSVVALGTNKALRGTQIKFPDTVSALLSFESGATGKITSNFSCVYPHFHKISLYGTKATFENDLNISRLYTERDDPNYTPITEQYRPSGKHLLIPPFIQTIRGDVNESYVSPDEVMRVLSVCFAIDESCRTGNTVDVEYI